MQEFLEFYKMVKEKCQKEMDIYNQKLLEEDNAILKNALEKFVYLNSDGKYLRASLVALGYSVKHEDDNYLPLALAIEIFQTSVLIHDDIIDKADIRRGKDTIPIQYFKEYKGKGKDFENKKHDIGNSMALCLGDLGYYLAFDLLLNYNNITLLKYYNDIVKKTFKGEALDVFLPFKSQFYEYDKIDEQIMNIYTYKTAYYTIVGPFSLGLILAGVNPKKYEEALIDAGIAFQIKDDIKGIFEDEDSSGKTSSDVLEYKQTILFSYTLKTKYKDELLKYYGTDNILKIREIFEKSGALKNALEKMNEYFDKSIEKLNKMNFKNKNLLIGFIMYLKEKK